MGRPQLHDEHTRRSLLDAAESLVEREGLEALSVRGVAGSAATTTRAVYSLFGSREGLLDALGARAFDHLAAALDAQPLRSEPRSGLIDAGADAFRRLATERPGLLRAAIQRAKAGPGTLTHRSGQRASARLLVRLERLEEAGLLPHRDPHEAAQEFHALCEGLASLQLRGALPPDQSERVWRAALTTMVDGLAVDTDAVSGATG
ncbi:TetR/AcrR family transcriptional regulator [Isoptericola aurantiacus]|uniref:TetR/AcrR family transcriptional regulator n=1 Tax=Isoptericola aurantiacus TaxID=3377839 RepID=UPI00383B4540